MFAVVKANAYGLGMKEVACALKDKTDGFCVATLLEAKKLAELNLGKKIIVLNGGLENQPTHKDIEGYSSLIIPTITGIKDLKRCASKIVNIKVNTGMNRTGIFPSAFSEIMEQTQKNAEVYSVFSHLSDPSDTAFTNYQTQSFADCCGKIPSSIKKHIYASNALTIQPKQPFDFIRAGLSLYGYGDKKLKPCLKVTTTILQILSAIKGAHVGYGNNILTENKTLASIRIGYADGFRRLSSERNVCINGYLCPVLSVCMDISIVDITYAKVKLDDTVEIVSSDVPLSALALSYGTNEYEALTSFMGERITRIYV